MNVLIKINSFYSHTSTEPSYGGKQNKFSTNLIGLNVFEKSLKTIKDETMRYLPFFEHP